MTELQKHLMQLVKEIDETCKENNISYSLYGRTAGAALESDKFTTQCYEFHIMMLSKDILLLKEKLKNKKIRNRGFEDLSNNSQLAWNCVRYVDTGTTLIDRDDYVQYKLLGVAVTIHPVFGHIPDKVTKVMMKGNAYFNGGKEYNRYLWSDRFKRNISMIQFGKKIVGDSQFARRIYRSIEKDSRAEHGKEVYVHTEENKFVKMNYSVILNTKKVAFENQQLPVVDDYKNYFKRLYGEDWKKKYSVPYETANRIAVIRDAKKPYTQYLQEFEKQGIDFAKLREDFLEYGEWYNETYRHWEYVTSRKFAYARRSRDRIDLYCEYKEQMDVLRDAAQKEDLSELKNLLKQYFVYTKRYLNYGLGFYINQEIFDLASLVWKSEGNEAYAQKVYSLVPDEYKNEDIKDFLAKYDIR